MVGMNKVNFKKPIL